MSQQSMRRRRGWRRHAPVANAEEPIGCREPFQSRSKIIMLSMDRAERLLVAQRMSTGSADGCEISFFPDDSDVRRTSRGVRCSERWQASTGQGADLETAWEVF